jgi:arginyl-tRNA--protein-N-Asp/Glu arginylyltransferase
LYKEHRKRFKGNASNSLSGFMYDNYNKNIFNTLEINIYDDGKLIGYSFFDVGITSMASIIGIFDQQYAAYSLGIYTMLLEMEYAKSMQFKYYYPGYVAYEPSQFNYKLRLADSFEFYDWYSKRWISFEKRYKKTKVNDFFNEKIEHAKKWLDTFQLAIQRIILSIFLHG